MKDNWSSLITRQCAPFGKKEWLLSYYWWMESLIQEPAAVTLKGPFTGVQGWTKHFSFVKAKWADAFSNLFAYNDCY